MKSSGIIKARGISYAALAPNEKGAERAMASGADEIAVFVSTSESFSRRNTNCSIDEAMARASAVTRVFETIELEIDAKGVCHLTLNRPDKHNALSARIIAELTEAFAHIDEDPKVHVLVLTGEGNPSAQAPIWPGCRLSFPQAGTAGSPPQVGLPRDYNSMLSASSNASSTSTPR